MTLLTWLIIFLLIAVNALYVAAEFAAVGVRHSRIRQLAEENNPLAVRLLPWIEETEKLDRYIAACQFGITLSSLALGAYGQVTLAVYLSPLFMAWGGFGEVTAQSTAAAVVLVGLTVLQVILGELVPKSIALQYPTRSALYTVLPMQWSLKLFSWFIAILNGSGLLFLRLFRIPHGSHKHIHSPEEIEMLIAESRDGGVLEPDEHRRLHRALRLGVRSAHQLMVPRKFLSVISLDTPIEKVLRKVSESPYSRLPVYSGSVDNVVGILHAKDVTIRLIEKGQIRSIEEVMRPVMSVPENLTADSLLTLLRQRRRHEAIVVDEFGGIEGLITLRDILTEMLGEVANEFDADMNFQPEQLPDGRVRLPGLMQLNDAEPWIGTLWSGEADTVGGSVIEVLGEFPDVGQKVMINGTEVEVERVAQHTVVSVLTRPVTPPPETDQEGTR